MQQSIAGVNETEKRLASTGVEYNWATMSMQ